VRRLQQRRWRVATVAAVVLVFAAGALAYWTTTGSGTAQATVTNPDPLTITAGGAPSTLLFPAGSGDVTAHIENPNPFVIHISTLALDTSQGSGSSGFDASPSGCNLASLSFTAQTNGGTGWNVPKKVGVTNGVIDVALAGAIHMSSSASNACQSATFTVYLNPSP
jgi:hypothetical protein